MGLVALALLAAIPTSLPTLDEALAYNATALDRAEAPIRELAASVIRLEAGSPTGARRAALIEGAATLRSIAPALLARAAALRAQQMALAGARAHAVVRGLLAERGVRAEKDPIAGRVRICSDAAWRAPVAGEAVSPHAATALGRPHGLTLVALPGASVMAPAAGRVVYAGAFRRYGGVVILDHGSGWTTLLTGLGRVATMPGSAVRAGDPLGEVATDAPLIGIELSRRGQAVDPRVMLRRCAT